MRKGINFNKIKICPSFSNKMKGMIFIKTKDAPFFCQRTKKGITPVIAIILLLLITISMVGFAYVWFNRVLTSTTEKTSKQLDNQLDQQAKTIRIDNIGNQTINIRNTGSVTVLATDLSIYEGTNLLSVCVPDSDSIMPGAVLTETCNGKAFCDNPKPLIKVSAPGNQDVGSCL